MINYFLVVAVVNLWYCTNMSELQMISWLQISADTPMKFLSRFSIIWCGDLRWTWPAWPVAGGGRQTAGVIDRFWTGNSVSQQSCWFLSRCIKCWRLLHATEILRGWYRTRFWLAVNHCVLYWVKSLLYRDYTSTDTTVTSTYFSASTSATTSNSFSVLLQVPLQFLYSVF